MNHLSILFEAKFRKRPPVVEALPPYELAKSKLVNFDLLGELRRAHADEVKMWAVNGLLKCYHFLMFSPSN